LTLVEDPHDVVVANLPYIGVEKFNFVSSETKEYEPNVALFGGADGLDLYRKLFAQILAKPWKPRLLLGEFGFLQGEDMLKLLENYFAKHDISIIEDYASIPRVFVVAFRQ
jgi:release factor glutamine methyltransferase